MDSEEIYSDSDYSGYSDDCSKSSFKDNSELDHYAHYFDEQGNIRHFTDSNILEAEEEYQNIKYDLRKPRTNCK